jgi:hypothetical protein
MSEALQVFPPSVLAKPVLVEPAPLPDDAEDEVQQTTA